MYGTRHRPHFFEVIELSYFRPEDMDDNITRINQHPVTAILAFDVDVFMPSGAQLLGNVISHACHMPLRATGCHHHEIGKTGFSVEIDDADIFTFVVIKGGYNQRLQKVGAPG